MWFFCLPALSDLMIATICWLVAVLGWTTAVFQMAYQDAPMPPEPKTNYQVFKEQAVLPVTGFFNELVDDVWYLLGGTVWRALSMLLGIAIALYLIFRFIRPRIITGVQYVRGIEVIRGEAMVQGSIIRPSTGPPPYQVQIFKRGIFVDTFIGYGLRLRDVLVAPAHVISAATTDGAFVIKTKTTTFSLTNMMIPSPKVSDVVYQVISKDVWSKMGISTASVLQVTDRPVAVSINGPEGRADGYATKSRVPHILNFNGSTIPGFSGAAYVSNGAAYGMHLGVANEGNIGVAVESLDWEIQKIIRGEGRRYGFHGADTISSSESETQGAAKNKRMKSWRASEIAENESDLFEEYENSADRLQMSFDDYVNAKRQRGKTQTNHKGDSALCDDFEGMNMAELHAIIATAQAKLARMQAQPSTSSSSTITFRPHAGEGVFDDVLQVEADPVDELRMVIDPIVREWPELKARVQALENSSRTTKPANGSPNPFPCDKCGRSFKTRLGMIVHKESKHQDTNTVKGESRPVPEHFDQNDKVKTVSSGFLGKTRNSAQKKGSSSKPSSKPSTSGTQSSSGSNSPSSVNDIQNVLDQFLIKLQTVISGPKEAPEQ